MESIDDDTAKSRSDQVKTKGTRRKLKFRRKRQALLHETHTTESDSTSKENFFDMEKSTEQSSSSSPMPTRPEFSHMSEVSLLYNSYSNDISSGIVNPAQTNRIRPSIFHCSNGASRMNNEDSIRMWLALGEDPTVEESVECVFSHQLETGNVLIDIPIESESIDSSGDEDYHDHQDMNIRSTHKSLESSFTSGRLLHVGNFVPSHEKMNDSNYFTVENTNNLSSVASIPCKRKLTTSTSQSVPSGYCCQSCASGQNHVPALPTEEWPQYPLLLRPTPGSGTKVRSIRFLDSKEPLVSLHPDERIVNQATWWESLQQLWGQSDGAHDKLKKDLNYCNQCCCIPINNGNEEKGRSLVVDFESSLFVGTILIRMRGSKGTTPEPCDDSVVGYFTGVNRQYQVTVKGRFKKEIPMTECLTGQTFSKPLNLPPTYVVKGSIKVLNFFSPRLQARLEGPNPVILSPLGSTPQTIVVDGTEEDATLLFDRPIEPVDETKMLIALGKKAATQSSLQRAKARKKAFDRLCSLGEKESCFRTDKVYTFEFLQHLLDFEKFEVNLGSFLGKFKMNKLLNGQPVNIMACHQRPLSHRDYLPPNFKAGDDYVLEPLWSFDVFHESIIK